MFEEDQHIDVGTLPKFDMSLYTSNMAAKDVKSLALRHCIPLDLHPVAFTKEWTMDKLSDDMIGLYEQYFKFSGIRVPFSAFLLAVIKHFRVHISQLVPLGLNRLTMFELYCRSLGIVPSVNFFHVFYKISKQGHWFSFEKMVGKGAGGQIFWLGTIGDQSGRAMTHFDTEVVQPSPSPRTTYHSPVATQPASPLRPIQRGKFRCRETSRVCSLYVPDGHFIRGNVEAGESSRGGSLYVPDWSIHQRFRLDTPMWCRELMVHLAPPAAQEESNALNNATTLDRAWFSLARGALAQTDILERFENLQADFGELAESHAECGDLAGKLVQARLDVKHISDLYNSLSDRFKAFRSEHEGYAGKLEASENCNREPSQVNKGQALRIKELEDTLAKKDSALFYLLPIVVERLLWSHEYQQSLSEPFNLAIQAGWGKGLAEERSEEDLLELMGRMEGFDAYADKKMKVEYDKLFEKQYHYVEKISRGFRYSVSDLLNVYPDSPPHGQAPPSKPSSRKAPSTYAP
ncbi:hypothetical protein Tco_0809421 [Tanacetum coccineum]